MGGVAAVASLGDLWQIFLRPAAAFGKPAITARKPFPVKHLHHNTCGSTGIDGKSKCVDNCHPPTATSAVYGGSREKISTNEP
jgi:hypothetical protein